MTFDRKVKLHVLCWCHTFLGFLFTISALVAVQNGDGSSRDAFAEISGR